MINVRIIRLPLKGGVSKNLWIYFVADTEGIVIYASPLD
jgi:hypothetical protein